MKCSVLILVCLVVAATARNEWGYNSPVAGLNNANYNGAAGYGLGVKTAYSSDWNNNANLNNAAGIADINSAANYNALASDKAGWGANLASLNNANANYNGYNSGLNAVKAGWSSSPYGASGLADLNNVNANLNAANANLNPYNVAAVRSAGYGAGISGAAGLADLNNANANYNAYNNLNGIASGKSGWPAYGNSGLAANNPNSLTNLNALNAASLRSRVNNFNANGLNANGLNANGLNSNWANAVNTRSDLLNAANYNGYGYGANANNDYANAAAAAVRSNNAYNLGANGLSGVNTNADWANNAASLAANSRYWFGGSGLTRSGLADYDNLDDIQGILTEAETSVKLGATSSSVVEANDDEINSGLNNADDEEARLGWNRPSIFPTPYPSWDNSPIINPISPYRPSIGPIFPDTWNRPVVSPISPYSWNAPIVRPGRGRPGSSYIFCDFDVECENHCRERCLFSMRKIEARCNFDYQAGGRVCACIPINPIGPFF